MAFHKNIPKVVVYHNENLNIPQYFSSAVHNYLYFLRNMYWFGFCYNYLSIEKEWSIQITRQKALYCELLLEKLHGFPTTSSRGKKKPMKWSEVIMVRSANSDSNVLTSILRELFNDLAINVGHEAIQVFHREKLESDICIVLFHNGKKTKPGGSPLGLRVVAALQEFSLVHHTVWIEMEN